MAYNKRQHLADNIAALEFMFMRPEFCLTEEGRRVLNGYSGFGGLKCILNPAEKDTDIEKWTTDRELFPQVRLLHELLREYSKDEKEYKAYVQSLKSSVLTAFYTPEPLVAAMQESLQVPEIRPGRFLDPSAGTGMFISRLKDIPEIHCFEKDKLTGKILSSLYPESRVTIDGFQSIQSYYNGYFDVSIR